MVDSTLQCLRFILSVKLDEIGWVVVAMVLFYDIPLVSKVMGGDHYRHSKVFSMPLTAVTMWLQMSVQWVKPNVCVLTSCYVHPASQIPPQCPQLVIVCTALQASDEV